MYPSGKWRGWWEQTGKGRQPMEDFVLFFNSGTIQGGGRDMVGPFVFMGTCDDRGGVRMIKQYIGKHQVLYQGVYDGEGTIAGTWSIPQPNVLPQHFASLFTGPFAISPVVEPPEPDAVIETL